MILQDLVKKNLIDPPNFVAANTCFLAITGSYSYGMSTDMSDMDLYGFCIPPKHIIFPHLSGEIPGFGTQAPKFEQFIKHHIKYNSQEYDITIFSIIKFFQLCYENNPNMLDFMFVDQDCVLHSTVVAEMIRDNRNMFVSKLCIPKFKGYAYNQFAKLGMENYEPDSKRYELTKKFGYDVKNASHVFRLILQCEQLLTEGKMDLRKNADILKSIRAGEYSLTQVKEFFQTHRDNLDNLAVQSKLPERPPEAKIKKLLIECLEYHYGSLPELNMDVYADAVRKIRSIIDSL